MYRRILHTFLLLAFAGISAAPNAKAQSKPSLILGTTTSTEDSGLLDVLVPRFEKEQRIEVKVIAVGSGAALRMAARGDVDVVLVHSPTSEQRYAEAGDWLAPNWSVRSTVTRLGRSPYKVSFEVLTKSCRWR